MQAEFSFEGLSSRVDDPHAHHHLAPGGSLGVNLQDAGLEGVRVAVVRHGGDEAVLAGGDASQLRALEAQRDRVGVVGVVALRLHVERRAGPQPAEHLRAVVELETGDMERAHASRRFEHRLLLHTRIRLTMTTIRARKAPAWGINGRC